VRALITGGSGYLGRALLRAADASWELCAAGGRRLPVVPGGRVCRLDVREWRAVHALVDSFLPTVVIHTAAINPGGPRDLMMAVNRDGSRHVAAAAAAAGARLVHISTDVVHDGAQAPYDDDAPPTPLDLYPRSKAEAEAAVLAEHPDAVVVRTSLLYGLEVMDRSTRELARRLRAGQTVGLFTDVLRQPIWVDSLAEAVLALARGSFSGHINLAGDQVLTREEYGRRLLAWWRVHGPGCLAGTTAAGRHPPVPLDLRLSLERARSVLGRVPPGVDAVLAAAYSSSTRRTSSQGT